MFTKEQLEAIAEKLPQKTRRIEKYNDQLVMHVEHIFFEFYKQNHNRETNSQYVEATIQMARKTPNHQLVYLSYRITTIKSC